MQVEALRARLAGAARESLFWRRRLADARIVPSRIRQLDDLARLPPLAPSELRRHLDEMTSRAEVARWGDAIREVRTTGTSGTPTALRLAPDEVLRSMVFVLYAFLEGGARWTDAFVQFAVVDRPRARWFHERLGLLREHRLDLRAPVEESCRMLRAIRPAFVYGFPSHLSLVAACLEREGSDLLQSRRVFSHGEVLTPAARRLIARAFGGGVRDTYGSTEFNRIAYACSVGALHVIPSAVVLEIDPATRARDGSGEVLVTSLYHRTTPLFRYRLGDRVRLGTGQCPCGSSWSWIARIDGRADDVLVLPSGRRLTPRAINLLEDVAGVLNYQIVQPTAARIDARVEVDETFDPAAADRIGEMIRRGCGEPVDVRVEQVARLERLRTGKLQAVVSLVGRPSDWPAGCTPAEPQGGHHA